MLNFDECHSVRRKPERAIGNINPMARSPVIADDASFIGEIGDEFADAGVHPTRHRQEYASLGENRAAPIEEVVEGRESGVAGMHTLNGLGKLHLITNKDDVPCSRSGCDKVRNRYLAGLIDEQMVECLIEFRSREQPGSAADDLRLPKDRIGIVRRRDDHGIIRTFISGRYLFRDAHPRACFAGTIGNGDQEVINSFVGIRGDRDPTSKAHEIQDCARAHICLARPGRSLDRKTAIIKCSDGSDRLSDNVGSRDNRRVCITACELRVVAPKEIINRAIPSVASDKSIRDPPDSIAQDAVGYGRARN
jgi:hypothetical protein